MGTVVLYAAYLVLAASVLAGRWEAVTATFATGDTSYLPEAGVGSAVTVGVYRVVRHARDDR